MSLPSYQTAVTGKDATLPVTLAEAKEHLRILSNDLDEYVDTLVAAATEYCEGTLGRSLRVSQTLTQKYRCWPRDPVRFDRQPVAAITGVTYYDSNGDSQTLASSKYRLHASTHAAAYLEWDDTFDSPSLDDRDDAVTITYTAGYVDIASVPATAKHAIKLIVGHWFNHGEAVNIGNITSTVPLAADALLSQLEWGCYR